MRRALLFVPFRESSYDRYLGFANGEVAQSWLTKLFNANGEHALQIVLGEDAEGDERLGVGDAGHAGHLFRDQLSHCFVIRHANDGHQIKTAAHRKHFANPLHLG